MAEKFACCDICKGIPVDPRRLPCDHVFCEKCLRQFIVSYRYDRYGYFPCPQCKFGIIVPLRGIDHFNLFPSRPLNMSSEDKHLEELTFHRNYQNLLRDPIGLACTANNLVAITDRNGNKLLVFTLQKELLSQFVCKAKINALMVSDNDTLLVTNNDMHQPLVLEFNLDGTRCGITDTLHKMVPTDGVALLRNPKQIVLSSVETSTLYVLDECGRLIKKYSGKALLGDPYFLSTNSYNEIIVSDHLNHFVKVINHKGKIKYQMGGVGNNEGSLFEPKGICVDKKDNIIVADSGNRCIKCFSRSGKFLRVLVCCSDKSTKPINVALTKNDEHLVVLLMAEHPNFEVIEYIQPK